MTLCPYCGQPVTAQVGQRGTPRRFCEGHQRAFHDLMASRGKVMLPFAITWQALRHSRRPEDRALRAYAWGQMNALTAKYAAQDRAAGRCPELVIRGKMDARWMAADLIAA